MIYLGSSLSVMHPSVYRSISESCRTPLKKFEGQIKVADGRVMGVTGQVELWLKLSDGNRLNIDLLVAAVEAQVVFWLVFFGQYKARLDVQQKS